jgi:hypothetical protein
MADSVIPCPECGGVNSITPSLDILGNYDEGCCDLCDGYGTIPDRRKPTPNDRALQHLLNCLNAVTAKHRHGQPISKRRLDDLSNAQVEYEEASRG